MKKTFNRPDVKLHGLDAQVLIMVITWSRSTAVWTLGHAVRTPSSILIITFCSKIGLGRNQRHLKANKK
jgi:hypothetical protein